MTQTTSEHRLSRRFALKGAGVLAAALAVPAAAVVAPTVAEASGPETAHDVACFHRVHRLPGTDAELHRLQDEFQALVSHEVWSLYDRIVTLSVDRGYDEQNVFIDELCRHFPGLAPAIRYVAYHHIGEQRLAERGRCCEDPPAEACNEDCDPERCPGGGAVAP